MALKSTVFKAELQISDMDRNHYGDASVTLARHPSENDERMMARLLAFALHADDGLTFGDSIGNEEEPSLWKRDLTGVIRQWIDVGQPDDKRIRKACGRASEVIVYAYGGHDVDVWMEQIRPGIERTKNLTIIRLPAGSTKELARLAERSMKLQFTIQDRTVWIANATGTVQLDLSSATLWPDGAA